MWSWSIVKVDSVTVKTNMKQSQIDFIKNLKRWKEPLTDNIKFVKKNLQSFVEKNTKKYWLSENEQKKMINKLVDWRINKNYYGKKHTPNDKVNILFFKEDIKQFKADLFKETRYKAVDNLKTNDIETNDEVKKKYDQATKDFRNKIKM